MEMATTALVNHGQMALRDMLGVPPRCRPSPSQDWMWEARPANDILCPDWSRCF
jgi:hypothetical protein